MAGEKEDDKKTELYLDLESIDELPDDSEVILTDEQHDALLQYLLKRLDAEAANRSRRLRRYARVDQMISTWQKLNAADSRREQKEESDGKLQAIPMNIPIAQAHVDDAVAFYAEVFAPVGGNFYANPGKREQSEPMKELIRIMQADMQQSQYYANICKTMRAANKYNFCGFHVYWQRGINDAVGAAAQSGNRVEALDVYNLMWDSTVADVSKFHLKGEWAARFEQVNRLWLYREKIKGNTMRIEQALECSETENGILPNTGGKAKYFKHPPAVTNIEADGSDSRSAEGDVNAVDWESYNLGLESDNHAPIAGHEVIRMYCWVNPKQLNLELGADDSLELWEFTIVDAKWVIRAEKQEGATEIPIYLARLNQDEMEEAARSIAEHLRPFQRFVSFLMNTHVEGVRGNLWGMKAVDPSMFDTDGISRGEVAGILKSKKPGADVRTGFMNLKTELDTRTNIADAGNILDLMKQFFPNQALPAQVAGMDRAVSNQVTAVMQGAMRKLHMIVRLMDSVLMQPVRTAQYRNIATNDKDKSKLRGITEEEVAALLNSGLGQIGREASAESLRTLIFALIQNPDSAAGYDIPGLFTLWSSLLNIGTDLGEFVLPPPAPAQNQGDPNATGVAAAPQPGIAVSSGGM